MGTRTNALTELTRFWLTERHGYLVRESVPVRVPYNRSDIDFLAVSPDKDARIDLPGGVQIGPRILVETKDEHDWDGSGKDFAVKFQCDRRKLQDVSEPYIPARAKGVCFSMLRQEHYDQAKKIFGTSDFDRLFVVHNVDSSQFEGLAEFYEQRRVFWITASQLLCDLRTWYAEQKSPSALRNTLMGDLFHLLFGYLLRNKE